MKNTPKCFIALIFLFALLTRGSDVIAQTHTMPSSGVNFYSLTGSVTYFDPGGSGGGACPSVVAGNYSNNTTSIETFTANPGQQIVVSWTGGLFGLSTGDTLWVYDGPSTAAPLLAMYQNTVNPIPVNIGASSGNSITFKFHSDATNTCKGWQAAVNAYYFMQNNSLSFSCPATYTFVDFQQINSGGPGGDATCQFNGGSVKDYQDANAVETFSTTNGQCISVDFSFPSEFGICSGDVLTVHDGPSTFSPIANSGTATYTNTFANPGNFSTVSSAATFEFTATANDHARGWIILLSCTNCPSTSPNNDCANAQLLTPSPTCNYISGSVSITNSNANPFLAPTCTGAGTANDDVWYTFTAINNTATITVAATDGSMDPVVQLFSGTCGSFTSLYCQNATGAGGTEVINASGLTPGTTYYVRVYDAASTNANHTFNICVVSTENNDCVSATEVCSTNTLVHTAYSNPDYGTQEWNPTYWGCDASQEFRSAWYYFQIATSGKLGFTISSANGSSEDDDFVLWGPLTGLNCPMNTSPIRCSWAIPYATNSWGLPPYSTGLETGAGDNSEGAGGDAFVETVNAVAGQWYVLMVNIYAGYNSYNITWMDNIAQNQQATLWNCILPISLESFTGHINGDVDVLDWKTISEHNNQYFVLERSANGEQFDSIARITAIGTTTEENSYEYIDTHPLIGFNYYRLKQVDNNGASAYSTVIFLDRMGIGLSIQNIYPNPSNELINVELSSDETTNIVLTIVDNIGRTWVQRVINVHTGFSTITIDVSSLPSGLYYLESRSADKQLLVRNKFVKY